MRRVLQVSPLRLHTCFPNFLVKSAVVESVSRSKYTARSLAEITHSAFISVPALPLVDSRSLPAAH
jgi:hypothetical protein